MLALHVSNRYLALDRVVARIAQDLGKAAFQWYDLDKSAPGDGYSLIPGVLHAYKASVTDLRE